MWRGIRKDFLKRASQVEDEHILAGVFSSAFTSQSIYFYRTMHAAVVDGEGESESRRKGFLWGVAAYPTFLVLGSLFPAFGMVTAIVVSAPVALVVFR